MPSYYELINYPVMGMPNGNGSSQNFIPILVQVRSQSESAALNSVKGQRNLFHEWQMCRQKLGGQSAGMFATSGFYVPLQNVQSDSEGDDSLVSSEEGGSSSAASAGCDHDIDVEEEEEDDDLGVVRDLDLDDEPASHPQMTKSNTVAASSSSSSSSSTLSSASFYAQQPNSTLLCNTATTTTSAATASVLEASASMPTLTSNSSTFTLYEPPERKRSVRFADDCGKTLETVRVMTEPSDYPPRISPSVIRRYRKAAARTASANGGAENANNDEDEDEEEDAASRQPRSSWKMLFKQPISDYMKFREILERQKVALENVMLKNDVGRMVGTIKVANIAFEKRVFIRFTCDNWKSYMDRPASYQSSPSKVYDTFRFDVEIPRNTSYDSKLSFCVCFIANGTDEHWDSNGGKNFHLASPEQPRPTASLTTVEPITPHELHHHNQSGSNYSAMRQLDRDDAYRLETSDWGGFASWKNLSTNSPYY